MSWPWEHPGPSSPLLLYARSRASSHTHRLLIPSLPPPPRADGPQRQLSGHLPLDISETPRASMSQGGTTIVLTVPLPDSILCSPFAQAQIPAPSGHHPVPHDPSPSSWSLASLAHVGDGSYGGWLCVAVSGRSCLSRAGVSELQGIVTPAPDLPPLDFGPQAPQGPHPFPHCPLPEAALLTWSLEPLWQVPLTCREISSHSREKALACLSCFFPRAP